MTGPRLRFVRPDERQAPAASSAPTPTPAPTPAPPALQVGNRGLVLHAAWLPPAGTGEHWLALWAEVETEPPKRHRSLTRLSDELQPRSHPFGARYSELVRATERLWKLSRPGVRPRSRTTQMRQELWLPALGTRPLPSPELVRAGWAEDPALYADDLTALPLAIWRTDALWLDAESAGTLLAGLPHLVGAEIAAETETHTPPGYSAVGRTFAPRLIFGSDLRFWIAASKMTLDLLVRQRFLPGAMVVQGSSGYYGYGYGPSREMLASVWYAAFSDPADRARFTALVSAMPPLCRAGITPGLSYNRDEILTAHALLEDFTHIVVSKRIQQWLQQEGIYLSSRSAPDSGRTPSRYDFGYYGPGSLATRWLGGLSTPLQPIHLREGEIDTLMSGIGRWQSGLGGIGASTFRLCFRLTPPLGPLADESEAEPELVEAGAAAEAAMQAPRLVIVPDEDSAAQHNGHTSTPAPRVVDLPSPEANGHDPEAAQAAQAAQEDALATLDTGGTWRLEYLLQARDDPSLLVPLEEVWPETGATARFLDRRFDHPQAQVLAGLHQAGRLFAPIATSLEQRHPLGCDLSGRLAYDFLRESVPLLEEAGFGVLVPSWWKRAAPRPAMRLRLRGPKKTSTGLMGLDAVVSYDWKLALGDQELTKEELERLVALKEPLVRLRGQWVELRPDQVSAALEFVRAHPTGRMSLGEALRTSLTGETADGQIDVEEVRADAWIGDLIGRLASGDGVTEVPPPANLHGVLRPYQGRGLSWLTFLSRYGLGACLADDMGLGKCITGESLISTVLGPRTIGSLWQACIADGESDGDGGEWGTLVQPVLVNSFDGGEIICRPVRRIYRQRIAEPCRTVSLADGSRLSSTRRHRYLTPTGWKLAGELQVGDLVAVAGKTPYVGANEMPAEVAELMARQIDDLAAPGIHWCKVKEIAEFQHEGYVYDLQVPDTHNYIANGIITHNTVELLSLLLHLKNAGQLPKPVLLVCPTSVVGNWRHESARFAPDLRVLIHHGATRVGRAASERFAREVADQDLVVTTYSLLPRDEKILAGADWGGVVLDEAQNIKNVEAKQSQAARKLTAPLRVALTGTPVENRLSELWSIMDFLNPGYLGSYRRFHEQLAGPIEQLRDQHATARLQTLVRPFVLRRLKTDPTVISDLPEKIEMKEYVPLSREQVTLYEAVVRDGLRQIEGAEGDMARRGVILAMLSKLKQVCNHPAHFLGDGSQLEGRSGKLTRLEELIEELLGEGDRALIFTQFTAMGDRLQPYLQERFGVEVLYLHGGVPQQARERLVGRFQSADGPPLFLLSLKAGGTGLNLTQANHVIHFDRWWNPAVENQATDRAFRIGQTRNVQVRKFVCTGTLEERIDAMIEQKRELAESVIGTGEGWITEMTTEELRDLFSLRSDALAD